MAVDYGLRISQLGYDVKTCPDSKCVFTSKNNTLKIALTGTLSVVIPSGSDLSDTFSVYFDHGLGFVPAYIVNPNDGNYSSSSVVNPLDLVNDTRSTNVIDNIIVEYTMTSTRLTCYVRPTDDASYYKHFWPQGSNKTVYFKYFIFTEELS